MLDAVVIGGGYSGIYILHKLLEHGFKGCIYETGSDFGGVWYWNNYPGAKTDSSSSVYQLQDPQLYYQFNYRFSSRDEIIKYFHHVVSKWNIQSHTHFNMTLVSATYSKSNQHWNLCIKSKLNHTLQTISTKFLFLCTGFSSSRYIPSIPGIHTFQGEICHSSYWPKDRQIHTKGKRVGIIGTGPSGIQIIQAIGANCKHLTVYQRTPNFATPMRQRKNDSTIGLNEVRNEWKLAETTFSGMEMNFTPRNTFTDTPEQRRKFYEHLYELGGFHYWLNTYQDCLLNEDANAEAYAFWAHKTRSRIHDAKKRNILAPLKAPHPFGVKRVALEENYFEIFNLEHVDIVDVNESPILQITKTGIQTQLGHVEVDILILATGFDGISGGILDIDIINGDDLTLKEKWKDGIQSYLSMMIPTFPNMFYTYGPHSPCGFGNGTLCAKIQGDWLIELLVEMKSNGFNIVDSKTEYAQEWKELVDTYWHKTLFPLGKGWYQGLNIPGKKEEPLVFVGGMHVYIQQLQQNKQNQYIGLTFQ